MGKSKSKSKSSRSTRDKRAARSRAAREARRDAVAEREAQRRLDELFSETTPVTRSAELVLERLDGEPVPARISQFFVLGGSVDRARAVAAEVERRAPGGVTALTLAADVALHVDEDRRTASQLLDRVSEPGAGAELGRHLLEVPSLSTSGETLTIEELLTLRARTENAGHGDDYERSTTGC